MASPYETLRNWARRTSAFPALYLPRPVQEDSQPGGDTLVYRLKRWPDLPARHRTADVYRALSFMSTRPVNRSWFVRHVQITAKELDALLQGLVTQGAIEVLDVSSFQN